MLVSYRSDEAYRFAMLLFVVLYLRRGLTREIAWDIALAWFAHSMSRRYLLNSMYESGFYGPGF